MCNNCLKQFNCPYGNWSDFVKQFFASSPTIMSALPFCVVYMGNRSFIACPARKPDSLEITLSNKIFEGLSNVVS